MPSWCVPNGVIWVWCWPGLAGCEDGDGDHPGGLFLIPAPPGIVCQDDLVPRSVPLGVFGDSDVGVDAGGADLYLGAWRRAEVAEPLWVLSGSAAGAGHEVAGAMWEEPDRHRARNSGSAAWQLQNSRQAL